VSKESRGHVVQPNKSVCLSIMNSSVFAVHKTEYDMGSPVRLISWIFGQCYLLMPCHVRRLISRFFETERDGSVFLWPDLCQVHQSRRFVRMDWFDPSRYRCTHFQKLAKKVWLLAEFIFIWHEKFEFGAERKGSFSIGVKVVSDHPWVCFCFQPISIFFAFNISVRGVSWNVVSWYLAAHQFLFFDTAVSDPCLVFILVFVGESDLMLSKVLHLHFFNRYSCVFLILISCKERVHLFFAIAW